MLLLIVGFLWLILALGIGYYISFANVNRKSIKSTLAFILLTFVGGIAMLLYAITAVV